MKKYIFLFIIIAFFAFAPIKTYALSFNDVFFIADQDNAIFDENNYNQEQTCTGSDSVLGDPNDEDSVAWLLDKILTYATIAGMLIVVVLSSVDFLGVIVSGKEDAIAGAAKKLGFRLLLALLLFFVPTITNTILSLFGLTSESTCGLQQN